MRLITGFDKAKKLLDRSSRSGRLSAYAGRTAIFERKVTKIINTVINEGDHALYRYTYKLDHVKLQSLEVSGKEILAASKRVNSRLIDDLKVAANRITQFHQKCLEQIVFDFEANNLGRRIMPLSRVGIYVPGGTAAYPSTVLMTAIPANIAGVREIVMVSPPQKNGQLPDMTLLAAKIVGIDRIYKVGGAQAVAALAYGTESIPKVDKICGPGNIFVSIAKRLVYGMVDIDGIQGPSEIIVIADDTANPAYCAADLIAQAEHDELSTAILITDTKRIADKVQAEISRRIKLLKRKEMISKSLANSGLIAIVKNITEAIELTNLFAPEHLMLMLKDAKKYLHKVANAGCVFLGESSPVVLGDYIAGPSHVLPTGGTARFSSGLGIDSFMKTMNYVALSKMEQNNLGPSVIRMAKAEGLDAHANAINIRLKQKV